VELLPCLAGNSGSPSNSAAGIVVLSLLPDTTMTNDIMTSVGGEFIGRCLADVCDEADEGRVAESLMGWYGAEEDVGICGKIAKTMETMWTTGKEAARSNVRKCLLQMSGLSKEKCERLLAAIEDASTRDELRAALLAARKVVVLEHTKNVLQTLGFIHRTRWHKALATHRRLVGIQRQMVRTFARFTPHALEYTSA